jgi:predicted nucleotidyltransferase
MKRNHPINDVEETLSEFFKNRQEVQLAYLFGSFVTGSKRRFQDLDIAILVSHKFLEDYDKKNPYGYEAAIGTELAHALKYDPVDILILNQAPPVINRQVIITGKLIYCESEKIRINFEISTLKRYADTEPIRRIKRFYMNKRIEKGLSAYVR